MTITTYNSTSDKRVLNKNITKIADITADIITPTDILNPSFVLDKNNAVGNYIYCDELHRYYYIDSITQTTAHRSVINCSVDVRMSWADDIKALTGTIDRQENMNNGYIIDERYKALAYKKIVCKAFPLGLDNDSIILMTVGGGGV
jgi:hypothetical protein